MRTFSYRPAATKASIPRRGRALFLVAVILAASACASSTEKQRFQAIDVMNTTAQSAARAFGVLYQAHKAENPALWSDRYDKAKSAYEKYQAVALKTYDAARAGGDISTLVPVVQAALDAFIASLMEYGIQ